MKMLSPVFPAQKVLAVLFLLFVTLAGAAAEFPGFPPVETFRDHEIEKASDKPLLLTEAADGRLVAASSGALYVFDGRAWRSFNVSGVDAIISLSHDIDGRILLCTYERPGYLRSLPDGRSEFVSLQPFLPKEFAETKLFFNPTGARDGVYFTTFRTVFRWDRREGIHVWKLGDIFPYVVSVGSEALISDSDAGLLRVGEDDRLTPIPGSIPTAPKAQGQQPQKITAAAPFGTGWLMVTQSDGLRFFDGSKVSPLELPASEWLKHADSPIIGLQSFGGGYVATTSDASAYFFDLKGNVLGRWQPRDYPGLTSGGIYADRNGNVWAPLAGGVMRISFNPGIRVLDVRANFPTPVSAVFSAGGKHYFNTANHSFVWTEGDLPNTGQVVELPGIGEIEGVCDGDMFYSPVRGGTVHCRYADGRDEAVLSSAFWVVASHRDPSVAYALDLPQKISLLHKTAGRWKCVAGPVTAPQHLSDCIEGDRWLWFTLGEGRVARADRTPFLANFRIFDTAQGLPERWIRAFAVGNEVLFATRRGIYRFDEATERFSPDPRFANVPEKVSVDFRSIATDSAGNIWLGSTHGSGIMRRQPDGSFRWDLGPLSVLGDLSTTSMTWDPEGWMWCIAGASLFAVRPDLQHRQNSPMRVLLEGVRDLRADVPLVGAFLPSNAPAPTLDYRRNSLEFELAATEYEAPGTVEFETKLEGRDSDWTRWSGTPVYRYPGLHEGSYRFHFRARNAFGEMVEGTPFDFTIEPPLYRTKSAYFAYVLLAGGLLWSGAAFYGRHLRARNQHLEALVAERTRALEHAQRELIDSSRLAGMAEVANGVLHNVGNALNSVNVSAAVIAQRLQRGARNPLGKVAQLFRQHEHDLGAFLTADERGKLVPKYLETAAEQDSEERSQLLKEVEQLTVGIQQIKEIVAMQQVYASKSVVAEALEPAALFEDALRLGRADDAPANVTIDRQFAVAPKVTADRGKVLQILVTLIENALQACARAQRADARVTLQLSSADGHVRFTVADNGVGLAAEDLTRIFAHRVTTRKNGYGYGLHAAANAAREMQGRLNVTSPGPGGGARFTLELPAAP